MEGFKVILNVLCLILSVIVICTSAQETVPKNGSENIPISTSTTGAVVTTISTTTTTPVPTTAKSSASLAPQQTVPVVRVETPDTLSDFIVILMKKFGAAKAAEALQSLDTLPLGLIMKILLVEVDKQLAADIVAMQRYAQSTDKALIQMIGRIVAGDKNVPKEIFSMDQRLMKYGWWMRIRQRMFNNLEKYVAAYSLVPVAAKTAIGGGGGTSPSKSKLLSNGFESLIQGPQPDLTIAVAASATESYTTSAAPSTTTTTTTTSTTTPASTIVQQVPNNVPATVNNNNDNVPSASAPVPSAETPLRISLLNPIQQQQILETLALAQAAAAVNTQVQQLQQFQQQQKQQYQHQHNQQQATVANPLLQLLGLG